jgi:NDP-sugar pyrophosphorylase family protein
MSKDQEIFRQNFQEQEPIKWPETMWPLDIDILSSLPSELQPSKEELTALRYPYELLELMQRILKERVRQTKIHPEAKLPDNSAKYDITGPVWIDEGATINRFTILEGPLYIGKNAIVGDYSFVQESVVMEQSLIGMRDEVKRSILGVHSSAPHSNFVSDSILSEGVSLGGSVSVPFNDEARTGTSNRRLDRAPIIVHMLTGEEVNTQRTKLGVIIGKDTRTAGAVNFMPGKLVGRDCIIYPRSTIFENVPDGTSVKSAKSQKESLS